MSSHTSHLTIYTCDVVYVHVAVGEKEPSKPSLIELFGGSAFDPPRPSAMERKPSGVKIVESVHVTGASTSASTSAVVIEPEHTSAVVSDDEESKEQRNSAKPRGTEPVIETIPYQKQSSEARIVLSSYAATLAQPNKVLYP